MYSSCVWLGVELKIHTQKKNACLKEIGVVHALSVLTILDSITNIIGEPYTIIYEGKTCLLWQRISYSNELQVLRGNCIRKR